MRNDQRRRAIEGARWNPLAQFTSTKPALWLSMWAIVRTAFLCLNTCPRLTMIDNEWVNNNNWAEQAKQLTAKGQISAPQGIDQGSYLHVLRSLHFKQASSNKPASFIDIIVMMRSLSNCHQQPARPLRLSLSVSAKKKRRLWTAACP